MAFDVLFDEGVVTGECYRDRRARLEALALQGRSWCTSPSFEAAGAELFAACVEMGLEGLMAKRPDGRYSPITWVPGCLWVTWRIGSRADPQNYRLAKESRFPVSPDAD